MSSHKWTVSQAAQILGVSEKTIYRRIKSGKLKAKIEGTSPTAHWMITPVDTKKLLSSQKDRQESGQESGQDRQSISGQEISIIAILKEQLKEKDRQIGELHVLLREAQGQIKAILPAPEQHEEQTLTKPTKKKHWWWPF